MKSSSFINESVFSSNLKILKKQNETKELFFRCLDEERTLEYFKRELEKIWNNLDYSFLKDELVKYQEIIHEENIEGREEIEEVPTGEEGSLFGLVPLTVILTQEGRYKRIKEREYRNSLMSFAYENDKEEYLKKKVSRYNDDTVPYYSKKNNDVVRHVSLNTYTSMIHNTNLTRTAWNTTLNDANKVGVELFYIPYHSFSCPDCIEHQNKIMTKEEVIDLVGSAEEAEGDILHPNCKCTLVMLSSGEAMIKKSELSDGEKEEIYDIRQKVNSLTLEKERLLTDIRIQKELGNQDEVDKLNQQRRKINSKIKNLQEELPTEELQKQVTAINR